MVKAWHELSVLIAGCGSIGKRHARVLRELDVKYMRACDPIPAQRRSLLAEALKKIVDPLFLISEEVLSASAEE